MLNPFTPVYNKINAITNSKGPCPDFPLLIDIEITSRCNLKCLMCEHTYMKRKQEMMTEEIFKSIIEQCKGQAEGVRFIMYSEPFLHPDILSFAKEVKEAGLLLHITTNGTIVSYQQIDELIRIGLDSIIFSMQGATEKEYSFIRGHDKLPLIEEKIKYLTKRRKTNPFVQVSTTVTQRDTKEDIEKFKQKWNQYVDLVTVGLTSWSRIAKFRPDIYKILGITPDQNRSYLPCQDILTKMCVYSNGDITVCCSDAEGKLTVGNVLKDNMIDLWRSEVYRGLRLLLTNMRMDMLDLCKDCFPAYDFKDQ